MFSQSIAAVMAMVLGLASVAGAEENAKSELSAPADGVLLLQGADPGNTVGPLFLLSDNEGGEESAPAAPELGEYWIGILCAPVNEEQSKELKLEESHGLYVNQVIDGSPAADAGVAERDVLLKLGRNWLDDPKLLIEAVNEAKDSTIRLTIWREGKEIKVEITPAKRPARYGGPDEDLPPGLRDMEQLMKQFGLESFPGRGMQFHVIRPGTILPPDATVERNLPEDMSISITKTGKNPAKIVVEKGDDRWEVTEKELDKLPKEVRSHVDAMLGHNTLPWMPNVRAFEMPKGSPRAIPAPDGLRKEMEQRMESMDRRIEELINRLDRMQGERGTKRLPKEKGATADKKPSEGKSL
ncbi:MAG: PDZ domain-containing protein [Planctomycetota bacterium]